MVGLLVLSGCIGGGSSGPSIEAQVNATIDKWIQGILSQNPSQIKEALASTITVSLTDESGATFSATLNPDDYIDQFVGGGSSSLGTYTQGKYEVTGRKVNASGSQAVVTGFLLQEYTIDYDSEFLTDGTFRETANLEITLVKAGGEWEITKLHMTNFKLIEI